jgi:hypothetical protein
MHLTIEGKANILWVFINQKMKNHFVDLVYSPLKS